MRCETKYRPIIWRTSEEDRQALLKAYLSGDGYCPACKRDGLVSVIEERHGESA